MWSWSRNSFKSNTLVGERNLNVIMTFNVVNWRFFLQEKASHLFLGCHTSLFLFGLKSGKQFPLCPCLICVYAIPFFVPVSLNVASDDDDDDDNDVHMACFSSRSLKPLLSFFFYHLCLISPSYVERQIYLCLLLVVRDMTSDSSLK
jgi:hypothetical protein